MNNVQSIERDRRRVSGIAVLVVIVLAVLATRVVFVEVVQSSHWRAEAAAQSESRVILTAQRGTITDRNGVDLATDVSQDSVVVDPEQVDNVDYYAHTMSPVLGIDEATLRHKMRRERLADRQWLQYRVIADNVDANAVEVLHEMAFPGISVVTGPRRMYPAGSLAGALLGRAVAGPDGPVGASGLEKQYDAQLRGASGVVVADHAAGVEIPRSQHDYRAPRSGADVVLGLDEGIQYQAEQSLLDQVTAQGAKAGMAVVTDLQTGDVLAMASVTGGAHPRVSTSRDANLPLTYAYSPGSVMKVVAVSKALDSGCKTTSSTLDVPDHMQNGTFPLNDDESHPVERMTPWDILTQSSNVGTAMIAQDCFTAATLDAGLRSFGFGHTTGLDFHQEAMGLLVPPKHYGESGIISNAIGYSALVSPMQVLDAYATIARGGVSVQPRFVRATIDREGVRHNAAVHQGTRVVSETTAANMQKIFENVVRAGTGYCAAVPGYEVAGKTGTVRKLSSAAYKDPSGHFATFVGFAPATKPRLAAIVVLDDPSATYGGAAAGPVFSEIMAAALSRMQVTAPAPMPGLPAQYDQAHAHKSSCAIPHGASLRSIIAERDYRLAHPTTTTLATTTTTSKASNTTTTSKRAATTHTSSATTTTSKSATPAAAAGATTTTRVAARPTTTSVGVP